MLWLLIALALGSTKADIDIKVNVTEYSAPGGAGAASGSLRHVLDFDERWTSGTTADKADIVYSLNDASYTTTPTSKLDASAFVTVEIVCLIVKNESTTGDLQVGGDAAAVLFFGAAADYILVKPGGLLVLCSGADPAYATTAATADIIQITASAGTVVGDIVILGRSA